MKVAAALAAGNCVICKPAEITPFAPELFAQLCKEAGVPDGVLSILPANAECGEANVRHKKIRKISFHGGPITARKTPAAVAEDTQPLVRAAGGTAARSLL